MYSEAMLEERSDYLLVDDFDYERTNEFLDCYGFNEHEKEITWLHVGGKPVALVKRINAKRGEKKIEDVVGRMLMLKTSEIKTILKRVKELGSEILIEDKSYAVRYAELVDALNHFAELEEIDMGEVDEISTTFLVKKNVLFVDPVKGVIKPQSRLNLLAIQKVMKDT